jgi:hypothetical protein
MANNKEESAAAVKEAKALGGPYNQGVSIKFKPLFSNSNNNDVNNNNNGVVSHT